WCAAAVSSRVGDPGGLGRISGGAQRVRRVPGDPLRPLPHPDWREREGYRPHWYRTRIGLWLRFTGPAGAQLRPGQVGGEPAAAVPHRLAVGGGVGVEADRVAGNLTGIPDAVPQSDLYPLRWSRSKNSDSVVTAAATTRTCGRNCSLGATGRRFPFPPAAARVADARCWRVVLFSSAGVAHLRLPRPGGATRYWL